MKIYLAAPYTHTDPEIVNARVNATNAHAAHLMSQGHIVFSPISHSHYIAMENNLPTTFEFWAKQNRAMIDWCDAMVILTIPGWSISKGVKDEADYATRIGKNFTFESSLENIKWEEM